jgi:hypothetical protein
MWYIIFLILEPKVIVSIVLDHFLFTNVISKPFDFIWLILFLLNVDSASTRPNHSAIVMVLVSRSHSIFEPFGPIEHIPKRTQ